MTPTYRNPIRFKIDERKATEAASFLLSLFGGRRDFFSIIKFLYIGEREQLRRFGRPIIGDTYVSMKNGPVMSHVYNFIKNDQYDHSDLWTEHITREGAHDLRLAIPFEAAALSQAEMSTLEWVHAEYGHLDPWQLEHLTHGFGEWKHPGRSCLPIEPDEILREIGKTSAEMEAIRLASCEAEYHDALFPRRAT